MTRELLRLGPDDWAAQRDLRLAALLNAPEAFGTTHADMSSHTEDDWREDLGRIAAWQVRDDGMPVGMVRMVVEDHDGEVVPYGQLPERPAEAGSALTAYLLSLVVSPPAGGSGVGELLVGAVLSEAKSFGLQRVWLDVAENNAYAVRLYERCGFVLTGESRPHPRTDCLCELQMVHDLESRVPSDPRVGSDLPDMIG